MGFLSGNHSIQYDKWVYSMLGGICKAQQGIIEFQGHKVVGDLYKKPTGHVEKMPENVEDWNMKMERESLQRLWGETWLMCLKNSKEINET